MRPERGIRGRRLHSRDSRARRLALIVLTGAVAILGLTTASLALTVDSSHAAVAASERSQAHLSVTSEDDAGGGDSGGGGGDTGGGDAGGGDAGGGDTGGGDAPAAQPDTDSGTDSAADSAGDSTVDTGDQDTEPAAPESSEEPTSPTDESTDGAFDTRAEKDETDESDQAADQESESETPEEDAEQQDDAADEGLDESPEDQVDEGSTGDEATDDEGTDEGGTEADDEGTSDPDSADSVVDPATGTVSTVSAAGQLSLRLDAQPGENAQTATVEVTGSGLATQTRFEVWVFSSPQLVSTGFTDDAGSFATTATLPSVEPGSHTIVLRSTGVDGQPIETASGLSIGPDGTILAIDLGVDASALVAPALPASPKAPAFTPVQALDQPAAVVVTAIAGLTIASALGAGLASGLTMVGEQTGGDGQGTGRGSRDSGGSGGQRGGSGESEQAEGSVEGEVRAMQDDFEDAEIETVRSRGLRTRFTATGTAPGDNSVLHRTPGTHLVDGLGYAGVLLAAPRSPLVARTIADGAPVRAITGSVSLILPIAAIILGAAAAVLQDGVAQPPVLAILIPLLVIGALDALSGLLGWLALTIGVVVQGGIIGWESVRTLVGIALIIVGPGLIASSFREVRRAPGTEVDPWERLVDFVVVPLLGGWAAMNIALALPSLGGAAFPVAERAGIVGLAILLALIAKVLLEEAAARWFPERMSTVVPRRTATPGSSQRIISAFLRTAAFLFISAAFVGNVWQLWVAGALFLIPPLLSPLANRLPNNSRLWQILPDGVPKVGVLLLVSWAISAVALTRLGDSTAYAQLAFVVLAIPGFILSILGLVARGPHGQDVRWYRRQSLAWFYRIGGIAVLLATAWLALNV